MPLTGIVPLTSTMPPTDERDQVTMPRLLGRGAAAGAVAGVVTAGFSLLLAEPVIDRAVRLESARAAGHDALRQGATGAAHEHAGAAVQHVEEHTELFGRGVQHLGLAVSAVAAGVALGVLFAVVYALVHRRDLGSRPWERSLWLAGAALTGVWLLPFLHDPADPPGAGAEGDIGPRTMAWLGAMVIGVGTVVLAWRLAVRLRRAAPPARQGAVVAVLSAGLGAMFLLPSDSGAQNTPGELLWDFRLVSAASSVLLWAALGVTFGLLGLRARNRRPAPPPRP